MAQASLTKEQMREALEAVALYGTIANAARALGLPVETLGHRHRRARSMPPELLRARTADGTEWHPRICRPVENGTVIVFSDAHYWPRVVSTAHRALLHLIKKLKPCMVVANGDVFDGARISRHPRIMWQQAPSVVEELRAAGERLDEIEKAAGKGCHLVWTMGNHDQRFESFLSAHSPEYEGVSGFSFKERFPRWMFGMRLDVNAGEDGHTIIKHRWKGGIHASRNNVLNGGVSFVTGHLHSLKVAPMTDARGTRYGVDTGCLLELPAEQTVGYLEDGITDWRSGFVVLTFKDGRLMWPDVCHVVAPGVAEFRGTEIAV